MMLCGGITKDGMSNSMIYPCGVCSLRVKVNSVLCVQCDKWIHSRYAGVRRLTQVVKLSRNLTCRKCEWNIGEAVEQEKKLCDEVETVWELAYLGDNVSAGGGCEAAVPAKTRFVFLMS